MTSRRRLPLSLRVRRFAARVAAGVVTIVVLVGLLRGGARYFYCPMMHAVIDAPCCPGDGQAGLESLDQRHDGETAELRARDCCEEHVLAKLPKAAAGAAPLSLHAPLLALVPPEGPRLNRLHLRSMVWASHFEHDNRAGPPSAARHRAELMVFLN